MLPNDPTVLLSYVNMKLRDEFSTLDDMCEVLDLDREVLVKKLAEAGYTYKEDINQFR